MLLGLVLVVFGDRLSKYLAQGLLSMMRRCRPGARIVMLISRFIFQDRRLIWSVGFYTCIQYTLLVRLSACGPGNRSDMFLSGYTSEHADVRCDV